MKAYKHLIHHAIDTGHAVSVWDGEEWQVKRATTYKAIIDAIESVEEAQIRIYDAMDGTQRGWARVSPFGLADDETVIDHTDNEFMQGWANQYELTL
jgi:hypothetical protein